jgi:hypothetical protein
MAFTDKTSASLRKKTVNRPFPKNKTNTLLNAAMNSVYPYQ